MESIEAIDKKAGLLRSRSRSLLAFTLLTAILSGMGGAVRAQTFAEWFKQGSTQKKYLLQQIAALQVFSGYLRQGYQVAQHGLGSISGSLNMENMLHAGYYGRLKAASSTVRNNPQVRDILQWQADILTAFAAVNQLNGLSIAEQEYLAGVRAAVLQDCDAEISTLQAVLTDGKMQMSDAERLALTNKIHAAMEENYRFSVGFTNQARLYASQRSKEGTDMLTTRKLNGID